MKIQTHSFKRHEDRQGACIADVALVGRAIDDRGSAALSICDTDCTSKAELSTDAARLEYSFNGSVYPLEDVAAIASAIRGMSILVDSTTLGFVELFLCLRAAQEAAAVRVIVLYAEPESYRNEKIRGTLHRRAFELSKRSYEFVGVPGRVILMREGQPIKTVIAMGYEGGRMQRIFGQFAGIESRATIVLGVPPFQAGWDMNAYANIVGEMEDRALRSIVYCGAANPLGVYSQLEQLKAGCKGKERLLLAPIGTKPHGLGMALFAVDCEDVGLIYDCPEKSSGRSFGVGTIHAFHCRIGN